MYHVAQASQAKHGSLVDRGTNGGFAGSDVRIFPGPQEYALSLDLTVRSIMYRHARLCTCK